MACGMTDSQAARLEESASRWALVRGIPAPPAARVPLSDGPLSASLDGADLVGIRFGGVELVTRVGVRVRDTRWGTLPPEIAAFESSGRSARLQVRHARDAIDFCWHGSIELESRAVTYAMEGRAAREFAFNRIGIVILHPVAGAAGCRFRARAPNGAEVSGELPRLIGPQAVENGVIQPLFPAFTRLEIEPEPRLLVVFELEGDAFEMEDQRNWTDGSFKTYSTPVGAPVPHRAVAGQSILQRVRIEVIGTSGRKPRPVAREAPAVEVRVSDPITGSLPAVGIGLDSDGHRPSGAELRHLRSLRPAHVRADVREPDAQLKLGRALEQASAIGAPLELSLTLRGGRDESSAMLRELREQTRTPHARFARILVFHEDQPVTAHLWLGVVREILQPPDGVPLIGGTAAHFAELNRERPDPTGPPDGIAYSITPQVHDFDDASVLQTLPAQADTIRTAQTFAGGRSIHVSPVTLRPRPAPDATPAERGKAIDPRQGSLLAAAFTVGSVKALATAGARSITYYEATGPLGVMQRGEATSGQEISAGPRARMFPVYHVLRTVCAWRGAGMLESCSLDPSTVEALAVRTSDGTGLLLANLTPGRVRARVGSLDGEVVLVRMLDVDTAVSAAREPDAFYGSRHPVELRDRWLALELGPYAVATVLGQST